MYKKLVAVILVVFGLASATNAGTDIIRDHSGDQFNYNYAPPPPRPVYYAPPPPINVLIFPAYGYYGGPRFIGVHRFHDRRVFLRPRH